MTNKRLAILKRVSLLAAALTTLALAPGAAMAQRKKAGPASQADIERLQDQINEQKRLLKALIDLQKQYLANVAAITGDSGNPSTVAMTAPIPTTTPNSTPEETAPPEPRPRPRPTPVKKPEGGGTAPAEMGGKGTVVGKVNVKGGDPGQVWVYIEDMQAPAAKGATTTMKQEAKQFTPQVLVVQKGTKISFPNGDPIFHNVFSVTPGNSFDLGSYRQGEAKDVTMVKPGVVSVYCNMHPQMVGYILVTPSGLFTRAGKDGFYRLSNVPAGKHRVAAWTPNSKVVVSEVDIPGSGVVTVELALAKGKAKVHSTKDGTPYQQYDN